MAASSYMIEADTEAIWDTVLDTARYNLIAVRMAEFCNFKINRDATKQVVDTAFTPILEQFCEEVLILLLAAAGIRQLHDQWNYIASNTMKFLKQHYRIYKEEFDEIRESMSKSWHYSESQDLTFPVVNPTLLKRELP